MSNKNEVKKCKQCGATLVGKNAKKGLCSKCARKDVQTGATVLTILGAIGAAVLTVVKTVSKKD